MTETPLLKHTEVLRQRLVLAGAAVADVGCGDGGLVRVLARGGAWAIGIDPGPQQLARARAAERAADEVYLCALGEALPLPAACLDALIYFNALHHVPVEVQDAALEEAARVVRPGGLVYVQEPLAEGDYFELVRPIEDETEVRARAYDALKTAAGGRLRETEEFHYRAPLRVKSVEAFLSGLVAVDPARRPAVEAAETSLRQGFLAAAEQRDGAFWFEIPSRLNLLRRH
ncbi:class I SAM-dependent methyltransferase [Pelagibius sp. CAU 1746]|uniref:class I SAM-dependent methyltransferase n=1 Tax=Pelagibius sp. CAU 1746 TaxID=3140370 RepID=UPI00325BCA99